MGYTIPCAVMRGGTSKVIVLNSQVLPDDKAERDRMILRIFGSPDSRQIDGLGGADPLTSKLAIVSQSMSKDHDVNYRFGQVALMQSSINYAVSCGNSAAAVALYSVLHGFVEGAPRSTEVRILDINSGKTIVAQVPTDDIGRPLEVGDFRLSGVPGTAPEIRLEFVDPCGAITGTSLPAGTPRSRVTIDEHQHIEFSLVDCGNVYAFVDASELGVSASQSPDELENNIQFRESCETFRSLVAETYLYSYFDDFPDKKRPAVLKIAIVGKPLESARAFDSTYGDEIAEVESRIINQEKVHKAFAVTGAICVAGASVMEGSVVSDITGSSGGRERQLEIHHPQGALNIDIALNGSGAAVPVERVCISRTARLIMDGNAYL